MRRSYALRAVVVLGSWWCSLSAPCMAANVNLAPLATVTCEPAAHEDTLAAAIDGSPVPGLVFAVYSQGEGAVTLTFAVPRTIDRVRVHQGQRAYYSTAYAIRADRDGDGVFETELARVDSDARWGTWAEHSFEPVAVKAVRFQSLAGVSEGRRAHPVLGEIAVYGEADGDSLRELMRMGKRPDIVPFLKPMCLHTPLVVDGRPACVILVPELPEYAELGARVARAIASELGVTPAVTTRPAAADPGKGTVIALGQMLNNAVIERLYWNRYLYVDSLCPGPGAYVVQTVHNPYPWTAGHNVVVLGGSDVTGVRRAVERFESRIAGPDRGESLGYILDIGLPPADRRVTEYVIGSREYTAVTLPAGDLTEAEAQALLGSDPRPSLLAFQELALKYLLTGETPYLAAGRRVLDVMAGLYSREPQRHPTWPEETNSRFILAAWDAVEEAPLFSDDDRLRFTNLFLCFLNSLVAKTSGYGGLAKNDTIIWNHTTFPLMGLYWGGRYFRRYYDCTYMDDYLAAAAGAFRGQEKSWKPQCDADSYLTLTIGHTIEYALAENRMAFFENGNIRRYADYLIGICDNRGWAAGFGDSGVARSARVPEAGVPYAFWYTKDARYLGYLNAIHGGQWPNPYHQGVTPQEPLDHVGVRVFPLDRQVYDYTKTRSYYGESSGPPNVPFEQAFDKIAFRAETEALGQYFVLDGYARGKHLHYDGNAILKLTDRGEDWLIDGDYLVRNTTEHNMVSVVRDGRAEKLVPECAALLHHADLPTHGFTDTMMRDYNGVDWRRGIFWQKGGWIVVLDRMSAKRPGDYTFDCVFKCLDSGAEELVEPRRFRITRGGVLRFGNIGLDRVTLPGGDADALAFSRADSQLQFGADLDAGLYRITLFGKGSDGSTDSFWLSIDGEPPTAFHLPLDAVGPSSAKPSKSAATPEIEVATGGEHTLTVSLRERPGAVLERIVIEAVGGPADRVEIKAVSARPARKRPPTRSRSLSIVNADASDLSVARRTGSSGPVKYLVERLSASLVTGGQCAFQNLIYLDDIGEAKGYTLTALSETAVLAGVGEPVLLGAGSFTGGGIETDAAMFCVSSSRVSLVDATTFTVDGTSFASSSPVSVELDVAAAEAVLAANRETTVTLPGAAQAIAVPPGSMTVEFAPGGLADALREALAALAGDAGRGRTKATAGPRAAAPLRELWHVGDGAAPEEVRGATIIDTNGEGAVGLLLCRGRELQCYSGTGEKRWAFRASKRLRCVTTADLDGDGVPDILCGGDDEQIHILDRAGRERASHRMTERLVVGQGGTVLPFVNCLAVADLRGDGTKQIVAGCSNSQISAFDLGLERLWNRDGVYHGVRRIAVSDLDGDGRNEVLAADHYGSVHIIRADGTSKVSAYSELGDVCFDVGDLGGEGRPALVNGSSTGVLTAYEYPVKALFSFNNHGYAVRQVICLDLDGDGRDEVLVASDTGFLYALDGKGECKWQRGLGSAVLDVAVGKRAQGLFLVTGQRDGAVRILDHGGTVLAASAVGSAVRSLSCADLDGDGADEVIVIDEANRCTVFGGVPSMGL